MFTTCNSFETSPYVSSSIETDGKSLRTFYKLFGCAVRFELVHDTYSIGYNCMSLNYFYGTRGSKLRNIRLTFTLHLMFISIVILYHICIRNDGKSLRTFYKLFGCAVRFELVHDTYSIGYNCMSLNYFYGTRGSKLRNIRLTFTLHLMFISIVILYHICIRNEEEEEGEEEEGEEKKKKKYKKKKKKKKTPVSKVPSETVQTIT
ncbi:Hypothetical predicted protein [Octopus vulgaris]|uniref:Uncharacterized protein n=1 Tax=Octopus vulgaris TaxID=6645 RepID=A0AA36F3W8_OCTVU|nr:Hypothetical predicted protein [Octopus vulgaris]